MEATRSYTSSILLKKKKLSSTKILTFVLHQDQIAPSKKKIAKSSIHGSEEAGKQDTKKLTMEAMLSSNKFVGRLILQTKAALS